MVRIPGLRSGGENDHDTDEDHGDHDHIVMVIGWMFWKDLVVRHLH